ncbi:hypothetical protein MRX96_020893 [Rhipicephalus microplus]
MQATADTLSRVVKTSTPLDTVEFFAGQVIGCTSNVLPMSHEDRRQAQESRGECRVLISFCQKKRLRNSKMPVHLSNYASVVDELSVGDGVLLKGSRIVIPSSLRPALLTLLHKGHQGTNRTKLQLGNRFGGQTSLQTSPLSSPIANNMPPTA